jgi:hypothetical protein
MNRRYIDPHLDPMRAPSRAGQHPHLVPDGPSRVNPQQMYEFRQRNMTYQPQPRPVGQPPPPQKPGLFDNPFVLLGLGAIAAYMLMRSKDEEPRQNPAPAPQPQPQSFVVVAPGAQPVPVYTAVPQGTPLGMPQVIPEQKQLSAPVDPLPEVQKALDKAAGAVSDVVEKVVEKAQDKAVDTTVKAAKREYVRVTTQARDPETGAFLPAGTAKPRIEGAMTAAELQQKAKKKLAEARNKARKKTRKRS